MWYFSYELQTQVSALFLPVFALIGLTFAVMIDAYVAVHTKRIFISIDILELSVIAATYISNLLSMAWTSNLVPIYTILSVYCYIARPIIIVLFIYLVWDDPKRQFFWIPAVINILVYMTTFFRPWTFYIAEDGHFYRGPLGYTAHLTALLLLISQLVIALTRIKQIRGAEKLIPVVNVMFVLLGMLLDSHCSENGVITFADAASVFCCLFYYIWLHLKFVREHERTMEAEQRIQIMISQIQPHFLYNTLATIQTMCLYNPRKAAVITERFAAYLRQNMDLLSESRLIPFRKELDHTLVYAQIETARFPHIHLDYEIEDEDFQLPALTIQPIVENAIRHGVRGIPHGQIDISTNRLFDCHEIIIRDNGKGFEPSELPVNGSMHIGIQNVQERLQKLCGGTMKIDSAKGHGTCVTIRIPLGKENS